MYKKEHMRCPIFLAFELKQLIGEGLWGLALHVKGQSVSDEGRWIDSKFYMEMLRNYYVKYACILTN